MFNLIDTTIAIAQSIISNDEPVVQYDQPLEIDAINFANDVIIDGINDALNNDAGFVSGHFDTVSGHTVYVEINVIDGQSGDEFIFVIGGYNFREIIVQDFEQAIFHLFDYIMTGA